MKIRGMACVLGLACAGWVQAGVPEAIPLEGKLVQGGILRGQVPAGSQLQLDGEPVPLAADGHFVIGFDRDAPKKAQLVLVRPDGRKLVQSLAIAPRRYAIQRVNGVPEATVNPPPEVLERIRQETGQIEQARARQTGLTDFEAAFRWPLQGPITGVFGSQRVYNGEPKRPHYGVDIAADVGTRVLAPAGGVVTLVNPDMFYSGGTLIVDHGLGLSSTFIHLSRVLVQVGQRVEQGDAIAEVGQTGRANGPHLDWRMNWRDRHLDPVTLVGDMPAAAGDKQIGKTEHAPGQKTAHPAGVSRQQGPR